LIARSAGALPGGRDHQRQIPNVRVATRRRAGRLLDRGGAGRGSADEPGRRTAVDCSIKAGGSEAAAMQEVTLPQYAHVQRYKEWMPLDVRAAYRYLRGGVKNREVFGTDNGRMTPA
jgi:hypothetical protein